MPSPRDSRDPSCGMSSPDEPHRDDGVVAAAGRVALYPARAAMRASRTRIEASVENVLTGPELARIVDAVLAGPFPEELAHIIVERKVLERIAAKITDEIQIDRLVDELLARPEVREAVAKVAASDAIHDALKRALDQQTSRRRGRPRACAAGSVARARRARRPAACSCARTVRRRRLASDRTRRRCAADQPHRRLHLVDGHAHRLARRHAATGLARRCPARGRLGPPQRRLLRRLLEPRRTDTRDAADARPGARPTRGAAVVRARRSSASSGCGPAIIPCFAGFVPALFDSRRRGLPDLIAGTTVEVSAPQAGGD